MILLILRVKQMRGADAADFRHYRRIIARCIPEKRPVRAASTIDDVINRSRAQAKTRLYMPMFHSRFAPNQKAAVLYHLSDDAGEFLPMWLEQTNAVGGGKRTASFSVHRVAAFKHRLGDV